MAGPVCLFLSCFAFFAERYGSLRLIGVDYDLARKKRIERVGGLVLQAGEVLEKPKIEEDRAFVSSVILQSTCYCL